MSNEIVFANGIIFKLPKNGAPDFVKGSLSFKVDEAIAWLQEYQENGWCNVNLKVSRAGKPYVDLDTWKPDGSKARNVNKDYKAENYKLEDKDEDIF